MNLDTDRYTKIVRHAVALQQALLECAEESLKADDSLKAEEKDMVTLLNAISATSRLTAISIRLELDRGKTESEIIQALKEDCILSKIVTKTLLNASFGDMALDGEKSQINHFLKTVDFFQLPDEKIAAWDLNLTQ